MHCCTEQVKMGLDVTRRYEYKVSLLDWGSYYMYGCIRGYCHVCTSPRLSQSMSEPNSGWKLISCYRWSLKTYV